MSCELKRLENPNFESIRILNKDQWAVYDGKLVNKKTGAEYDFSDALGWIQVGENSFLIISVRSCYFYELRKCEFCSSKKEDPDFIKQFSDLYYYQNPNSFIRDSGLILFTKFSQIDNSFVYFGVYSIAADKLLKTALDQECPVVFMDPEPNPYGYNAKVVMGRNKKYNLMFSFDFSNFGIGSNCYSEIQDRKIPISDWGEFAKILEQEKAIIKQEEAIREREKGIAKKKRR